MRDNGRQSDDVFRHEHEIVIEPGRTERHYWRDLWHYRELFWVLAWRDLAVRYKQTVIGAAWALIRPLLTMVVFTIIFGGLARLPSDGSTPYALMVFAGMLPWTFFATGLADASNSLSQQRQSDQQGLFPPADRPDRGGRSSRSWIFSSASRSWSP